MNLINRWQERQVHVAILLLATLFFMIGRSYQVSDSLFTVLLGQSIVQQQSLDLKPYLDEPNFRAQGLPSVENIQLTRRDVGSAHERWVTNYPLMPVFLSVPLVTLTNLVYPVLHGTPPQFDLDNEIRQQLLIAAFLCAIYTLLLYRLARLWLDRPMALLALATLIVGSSVTSVLSRAVWTDTWANLLIMLALHHIAHAHLQKTTLKFYYWVPLMMLAFFCKPLYAFSILGIFAWSWRINPLQAKILIVLGMLFVAGYMGVSWMLHGVPIQPHYYTSIFSFTPPRAVAFFGVLVSPSRGIFVFWPWLIFMLLLLPTAWRFIRLQDRPILWLTLATVAPLTLLLGCFAYWFGGVGYGPRLMTPILPWVSLCAIIIFSGWLKHWQGLSLAVQQKKQTLPAFGLLCLMVACTINIYGMMQPRSFYQWYNLPAEKHRATEERIWDWRDPVWLAGIVGRERYTSVSPY